MKIAGSTALLIAVFCYGYMTARWQAAELARVEAEREAQVIQQRNEELAAARESNLAGLRYAEKLLKQGEYDDTTKDNELLRRTARITDGVLRPEAEASSACTSDLAARLGRAEESESRLRRALRVALDGNREDARRANQVARQLNLCITQLELDRQQLQQSQRQ